MMNIQLPIYNELRLMTCSQCNHLLCRNDGKIFSCVECTQYLCESCERSGLHPEHAMIRVTSTTGIPAAQEETLLKQRWEADNGFLEMLNNGDGSDYVIEVLQQKKDDGKEEKVPFNVHKFVVMANCEVIKAAITRHEHERNYTIKDPAVTATAVRQMIHYMYTGKVPDDFDVDKDGKSLVAISNEYQLMPLKEFVGKKLTGSLSLENVIERVKLAELYSLTWLKNACRDMILANRDEVEKNPKWSALKKESGGKDLAFSILGR